MNILLLLESGFSADHTIVDDNFEVSQFAYDEGSQKKSNKSRSRKGPHSDLECKTEHSKCEKCVGNHYPDLDADIKDCIDVKFKEEFNMLREDNIADVTEERSREFKPQNFPVEKSEAPKYEFTNKVRTNRAFLHKSRHRRPSQFSVTLAENYAFASDAFSVSNKHFDFVPVRASAGNNKYIINNCLQSRTDRNDHGSCKENELNVLTYRKGEPTFSQAPLIALQRSKTIYKNQVSPGVNRKNSSRSHPTVKVPTITHLACNAKSNRVPNGFALAFTGRCNTL